MITIILIGVIFGIIFLITIYVWINILFRILKKVSYKEALNFEINQIKEHNLNWDITQYSNKKRYKSFKTDFGNVNLYKFGETAKVVIFVHGIWSNNRNAIKILNYFISRNYTIISYDNFGWGKSRNFGVTTLGKKEALLLNQIIKLIKKDLNPQELIIYGESMGGATIYNYLSKFGTNQVDKYIINAGYMSFFDNIIQLGKKQIWYLIYLAYLPLLFIFWCQRWPIKSFLNKKQLKEFTNVFHIHSQKDKLVAYNHFKKFGFFVKHYIYKNPDVRHVLGWYDATEEHYLLLDNWLEIKKEK